MKLVKIDIDKNPAYAGQLRVQSIPTVFAFVDGQPVDGFMGAVPESQVKAFVDKLARPAPAAPSDVDELLALAEESLELGDIGGAAQAYAQVLQARAGEPARRIGGLARCYLAGGDAERAARGRSPWPPPDAKDADLDSVRAALALADERARPTPPSSRQRLAADPDDHEARFELAKALAGQRPAARRRPTSC